MPGLRIAVFGAGQRAESGARHLMGFYTRVIHVGLAQNYGTNDPQKQSCLVGEPSSYWGVDNIEP